MKKNNKISKQDSNISSNQTLIILFVLNPVIALIVAIRNFRLSSAKNVVWFFVGFFGLTMVISHQNFDAERYQ